LEIAHFISYLPWVTVAQCTPTGTALSTFKEVTSLKLRVEMDDQLFKW
jgi:hypothetical protein